ncbi:MAG: hypothetical protein GYB67_19460 [Chloroflexi bacterium]|nr:hypothetical protein [Chloroflexota bacterium]
MLLTRWVLAGAAGISVVGLLLVSGARWIGAQWRDSHEIAFVSYENIYPDIYITDTANGVTLQLTDHEGYDSAPVWSPDGRWLAFISDREGDFSAYVMDAAGGDPRRVTPADRDFAAPRWSRDGQRLLVFALDEAPGVMYAVHPDGSDWQQVTQAFGEPITGIVMDVGVEPGQIHSTISPDGRWTLFLTYRDQGWGLYITDTDRANARLLSLVGRYSEPPVWSPDGDRVAYISFTAGRPDLYSIGVNPDGSGGAVQRLTDTRAIDSAPSWRP